jgi:hypothetical protein
VNARPPTGKQVEQRKIPLLWSRIP